MVELEKKIVTLLNIKSSELAQAQNMMFQRLNSRDEEIIRQIA